MVPNKCQKQVRSIADGGEDALHRAPADVQAEAASVFTLLQLCFVSLASECRTPSPAPAVPERQRSAGALWEVQPVGRWELKSALFEVSRGRLGANLITGGVLSPEASGLRAGC